MSLTIYRISSYCAIKCSSRSAVSCSPLKATKTHWQNFVIINQCFRVLVPDQTCLSLTPSWLFLPESHQCNTQEWEGWANNYIHSHYSPNTFPVILYWHSNRSHIHLSWRCASTVNLFASLERCVLWSQSLTWQLSHDSVWEGCSLASEYNQP